MSFREALDATWAPLVTQDLGPFRLRRGPGGKRVSAASREGEFTPSDIASAEAQMQAWGQEPLFVIWQGDEALDAALAARGYSIIDPVLAYEGPPGEAAPPMAAFPHWPPMEIAREIWAEGHIGPDRLAVMERVRAPKAAILARSQDKPSGVGFVAVHGGMAMIHAVEVRPRMRRQGAGRHILQAAMAFGALHGATTLALAVTAGNSAARALYSSLGMQVVGQYHYRIKGPKIPS